MPLIYADTSVLFAHFHPCDEVHDRVSVLVQKHAPDFVYWNWLRFELRHNLRQANVDTYGAAAWKALRAAERTTNRLRWQTDLSTERLIDAADELSAEKIPVCGSGDVLHVAAARRVHLLVGLDEFWTCDAAQSVLAEASGLPTVLLK